jgi:carboxyl-terminal processing protease
MLSLNTTLLRLGRIPCCLLAAVGLLATLAPGHAQPAPAQPPKPQPAATESNRTNILTMSPQEALKDLQTFAARFEAANPLSPGPYDPAIATLAARIFKRYHYYRRALDPELSERFLDRYLDSLDPMHIHFLKSDVDEFSQLRDRVPDLFGTRSDLGPAHQIFARFIRRLDERVEFVANLLRDNKFEFTGSDRYTPNRKDAERPADAAAARDLWRQHLRYEYLQETLNKQKPDQILKTLVARYKRLLRSWGELDSEEVLQVYLNALAQAYDPHSDYMGKSQLDNFAISMKLSLFGIGALLRSEDGFCKIESLMAGGPAAASKKLKPNDRIIAVQQKDADPVDVVDMKLNKVVEMIRGPKNTEVTLTVIPADAPDPSARKIVTLVRDEIKLEDQEAKARIIDLPGANNQTTRLGLIDLPSFYATFDLGSSKRIQLAATDSQPKSTTADVTRLLRKLVDEGVQGVVLDLRRNGGGSLEEAIRLTGLFIKEGPIVQVKDANGDIGIESDPDPDLLYDGPLIVLTSRFSASASEILAAALQDYGRALIVGDSTTHGKGTVQTIYELNKFGNFRDYNAGALKVTIRKFYRANGWSTQLKGVTPDIVLPSVANYLEVGEGAQEFAMPYDPIPSAMFERLDRIQPVLDELRRRTEARQSTDKDFAYVRQDIDQYRKFLADKSVSLNQAQRLKEKEEADSRTKTRKAERKARHDSTAKIYEITLKNAGTPGLPAPVAITNEPPAAVESPSHATPDLADDDAEAAEDEKAPVIDVNLDETKRILVDLISILAPKSAPATTASTKL